jgi:hypothetical protein
MAACNPTSTQPPRYGVKVEYAQGQPLNFPDLTLEFVGKRKSPATSDYPRRLTFYDFKGHQGSQEQLISWSAGTGDIGPTLFELAGYRYALELAMSDELGSLDGDELVLWREAIPAAAAPLTTPIPTPAGQRLAAYAPTRIPAAGCQAAVDAFAALTQGLEIPAHLQEEDAGKRGEEFDVNQYFTVLTHLALETGYLLDYVTFYDSGDSWPVIYARQKEEEPYANHSAYVAENVPGEPTHDYLEHVVTDGSAAGYFEWVLLAIQGDQFYLGWHANYVDTTVLCDPESVARVIEEANDFGAQMTTAQEQKALAIDLEPSVQFERETVQVRIVTFTKWGGFFEEIFVISRDSPHRILEHTSEELVPYDCGVIF